MNKICPTCKINKEISLFYRNKSRPDGYCALCKECERIRYRNRRRNYREKDKKYYSKHKEKILNKKRIKSKEEPHKTLARSKVRYALKTGKITRENCSTCGDAKAQAHHKDYSKPLEVIWLCRTHHQRLHFGKADQLPTSKDI